MGAHSALLGLPILPSTTWLQLDLLQGKLTCGSWILIVMPRITFYWETQLCLCRSEVQEAAMLSHSAP